jgi:hypothetical protein
MVCFDSVSRRAIALRMVVSLAVSVGTPVGGS